MRGFRDLAPGSPQHATTMENDTLLEKVTEVDGCRVLGPCAIYSRLGQGGMGAVYRARHMNLGIDVAVKCLKPSLADAQFVKRFKLEAKSAARIGHQNVVRVFDVAEDQGLHYIIMELVQGETARQRVERKGPLAIGEALEILYGAALGLAEAHRKGIIHRDIKPDNILISSSGEVKLVDLGLAKPSFRDDSNSMLSSANQVMGTLQYMPPEQWESTSDLTMAADVWALGATFFFLVAGREAINNGTPPQIMNRIVNHAFPDVRRVRDDVPDEVIALLARATAKAVQDRFEDAEVLATAIAGLETRRSGLRDSEAGTTQLRTLVSPPPQRTLDKIQTLLQVGPGARLQTVPSALPAPSTAPKPASASAATPRLATAASGRRAAIVFLVLVFGAGALLFAPGVRQWVFGPPAPPGPFADADRFETQQDYAKAIAAAEEAYRKDESLAGRTERLGRLHASWSMQLDVRDQEYLEALAQIDKSIACLAGDAVRRQRSEAQRQQLIAKIGKGLEGTLTRGPASAEGDQVQFRGTLTNPSVKVKELRLGPSAVVLDAGGAFEERRSLGSERKVSVCAILDDAASTEIQLRPWGPDLAFVEQIVAVKTFGGRAVTASGTIQLRGRLTDPEAKLFLGDTEIPMVPLDDGSFTCEAPDLDEGENDLVFVARNSEQPAASCRLQVLRLKAPVLTVNASSTESARCPVEVTADIWTKTVVVIIAGKQFSLQQKADKAVFTGDVELAQGLNSGEIVATNVVDQQTRQRQEFERLPTIESVTLVLGNTSIPVKQDAPVYVNSKQAKVRVVTGALGARLLVNGKRLESQDLASGVDVALEDLEEGKPVSVSFQVGFDVEEIRSKPWQVNLVLDTVMPVVSDLKASPPPPQLAGTEITVSGAWQDEGGCASLMVDNQAADVQPAGKSGSGTWSVKLKSPDKTRDLAIVVKDLAGNSRTVPLPFEVVAAPAPPAPERVFEPDGFVRKRDCNVENGYPEFLIHQATRIELVANEFGPGKKPGYYIATQETTEQQWGTGSGTGPKTNETYRSVKAWLADAARLRLDLPTAQEWDGMPSQWQRGQGKAEWLRAEGPTSAPLRKEPGGQESYQQNRATSGISFRVVYRVP